MWRKARGPFVVANTSGSNAAPDPGAYEIYCIHSSRRRRPRPWSLRASRSCEHKQLPEHQKFRLLEVALFAGFALHGREARQWFHP